MKDEVLKAMYKQVSIEGQCSICKSKWCPNKNDCAEDNILMY